MRQLHGIDGGGRNASPRPCKWAALFLGGMLSSSARLRFARLDEGNWLCWKLFLVVPEMEYICINKMAVIPSYFSHLLVLTIGGSSVKAKFWGITS